METINPVEEFLFQKQNIIFSIKKLSKTLKIRKRQVYYYYNISNNIIKIKPLQVGCGKSKLNIFKFNNFEN